MLSSQSWFYALTFTEMTSRFTTSIHSPLSAVIKAARPLASLLLFFSPFLPLISSRSTFNALCFHSTILLPRLQFYLQTHSTLSWDIVLSLLRALCFPRHLGDVLPSARVYTSLGCQRTGPKEERERQEGQAPTLGYYLSSLCSFPSLQRLRWQTISLLGNNWSDPGREIPSSWHLNQNSSQINAATQLSFFYGCRPSRNRKTQTIG